MSSPHPRVKRYNADPDLNVDNTHSRVIRLVGRDKRVLELGCATGYMSRVLTETFGCVVTGVEIDPAAAEEARASCARVIVGDLEGLPWDDVVGEEQFDVVVAADVLEHLRNPAAVLASVRPLLAPGGHLVASIPNVAHTSVLAELLQGRFPYQPFGLLDDTHIRFFTRDSLYECLELAGFTVTYLDRLTLDPAETEFRTVLTSLSPAVVEWLASREESTTYQFILTARPDPSAGPADALPSWPRNAGDAVPSTYRSALESLAGQRGLDSMEGMLQAHAARMAYLENTRAHQAAALRTLREALTKHEDHVRAVTDESARRHEELEKAGTYARTLLGQIDALRRELERAGDYAGNLKRALAVSQQRLVQERERVAAALERVQAPLTRELQEERSRLAEQLEQERARATGQLERMEQAVARLHSRIETYEHSRSWRLTAPLRVAGRLLRGQWNNR